MDRPDHTDGLVSLAAVGDVFLGGLPENTLDKAIPLLEEHDLRFCVLEGPVSDRGEAFPGKMSVHHSLWYGHTSATVHQTVRTRKRPMGNPWVKKKLN